MITSPLPLPRVGDRVCQMNHKGEIFCFINNTTLIRAKTIAQLVTVFPGGYFNFHNEHGEYTSAQVEVNGQKMFIHLPVAEAAGTFRTICILKPSFQICKWKLRGIKMRSSVHKQKRTKLASLFNVKERNTNERAFCVFW